MKMKLMGVLALLTVSSVSMAQEQYFMHCHAKGNTAGIQYIDIHTSAPSESALGDVYSEAYQIQKDGKYIPYERTTDHGALDKAGFAVANNVYWGPFGIKNVYLLNVNGQYALQTKTFCNFTYQEEKCLDGDLLEESALDTDIQCEVMWD